MASKCTVSDKFKVILIGIPVILEINLALATIAYEMFSVSNK